MNNYDFPYNKYKYNEIELRYLEKIYYNTMNKSLKRIGDIKYRIINDIRKNVFTKKYQIRRLDEYECIKRFVDTKELKDYDFLWCHGDEKMNKLDKIIKGDYYCCESCDRPMKFIDKKVNTIYCYFYRKK